MKENENDFKDIMDIPIYNNNKFCFVCQNYFKNIGYIKKMMDKIYLCNKCCGKKDLATLLKQKWILTSEEEIEKILISCQFQGIGCPAFFTIENIFAHQEKCKFKEKATFNYEKDIYRNSEKSHQTEFPPKMNIILTEDSLKINAFTDVIINGINEEKDANQIEKAQSNFQGISSETGKVENTKENFDLNEKNLGNPIFQPNNVDINLQKDEIRDMKDKIALLQKTVNSLLDREKNVTQIISQNEEIKELKNTIKTLQNSEIITQKKDKEIEKEMEQIKSSVKETDSQYITEKNEFEKRIEYVLPNYEILLFQMHQLIEEEYQTYFDNQIQKILNQLKAPIIKQNENNISKIEINEIQIKEAKKIEKIHLKVESSKENPQNIKSQIDGNIKKQLFEEFKNLLSVDLKNEKAENPFRNNLIEFIMQLISKSEVNIIGDIDYKLQNLECRLKADKDLIKNHEIILESLEEGFREINKRTANMKTEYSEMYACLANRVEDQLKNFKESIEYTNLNSFISLKRFDDQFEQIYKCLGSAYNKVINLEKFNIKGDFKEIKMKTMYNLSPDHLKDFLNKQLTNLNLTIQEIISQNKNMFENIIKDKNEIATIKNSLEAISSTIEEYIKRFTGKVDSKDFIIKYKELDSKYSEMVKTINNLNQKNKEFSTTFESFNLKWKTIENSLVRKGDSKNLMTQEMKELSSDQKLISKTVNNFILDNFCLSCGLLTGCSSKMGFKPENSVEILCIKCNIQCSLCNNLISKKNKNKSCISCNTSVCPKCKYEKSENYLKIFPRCSQCKNNYCNKCLNFNGDKFFCKVCLSQMLFKIYSDSKPFRNIISTEKWDFSDANLPLSGIQNIFSLLKNSSSVSKIDLTKTSSLKTEENFLDFLDSILDHQSLKYAKIEISNPINPRKIFKLIEEKQNKIKFLQIFQITVKKFYDSQILNEFDQSFDFKWSPLNQYFTIEYLIAEKQILNSNQTVFLYGLKFTNRIIKKETKTTFE